MPQEAVWNEETREKELLLENFKAAANCLTNLYRNSLNVEKRAKELGVQLTLESLLAWVGEQASTGRQTVQLEELVSLCFKLAEEIGPGSCVAENPLTKHMGKQPCYLEKGKTECEEQSYQPANLCKDCFETSQEALPCPVHYHGPGTDRKRARRTFEEATSENTEIVWQQWDYEANMKDNFDH
eukprot:jgi/Galph1/5196/GphlegSOOS_G3890.1